ncbi:hypothetical protein CS0771_54650 [Catellatospora sp. IY07-71]|uniref:ALF repeat-containing protein n=1 Tax=Catellatospora sp. IY07-71 TaxID=2728827 RepID=UPI001BB3FC4B|nr:ALF repeat-containing protein [Catellatospora sp. IY07-71]BCJ75921.1 hypothetical protein CS0771_54650 [Catellatospora sp. IY07-71]
MRWKALAGIVAVLAWLVPAAPAAAADPAEIGLEAACRLGQPVTYPDLRPLLAVDVDALTDTEVRVTVNQVLAASKDRYVGVTQRAQEALDGTQDIREFLESRALVVWNTDLRVLTSQVMSAGGAHVKAAANKVLDDGGIDATLGFVNDGQHEARALDYRDLVTEAKRTGGPEVVKAATAALDGTFEDLRVFLCSGWREAYDKDQAAASPSPSASATPSASAAPSSSPAQSAPPGPQLPTTGTNTMTLVLVAGALIALGAAGIAIARRVRA